MPQKLRLTKTGAGPLRFLEMFKSARYADVSLNQWLALTPPELVRASLDISEKTVRALHKKKSPVVPATVSPSPIKGSATLTDAQIADLNAGKWYFNVHTAANPGGEIPGTMTKGK